MTDMASVLGTSQLSRVDKFNSRRTELAMKYRERLAEIDEIIPLHDPTYAIKHSWHLFIVRLDIDKAKMSRDEFMLELKNRNIGTGLAFPSGTSSEILQRIDGNETRHVTQY